MPEPDIKYRRKFIENPDADLPYINLSINDNLPFIKICAFIFLLSAIALPFIPSRSDFGNWTLPTSWNNYLSRVNDNLLLLAIVAAMVLLSNVFSNIRTYIDRRISYKKMGVFRVIRVYNLLIRKIVFLNNFHFFSLHQDDYGFIDIEAGQFVEIERSATHKLIYYQITN